MRLWWIEVKRFEQKGQGTVQVFTEQFPEQSHCFSLKNAGDVLFCSHEKLNSKSKRDDDNDEISIRGLKSTGSVQTLRRKNLKTSKKSMMKDLFYQPLKKRSKLKALSRRNPRPSKKSMRKHTSMQSLWTSRKNIRKTLCIQNMWASRRVSLQESSQIVTISILQ